MSDGEVAVQQNGHTHAVQAPSLDGTVTVDVDQNTVHLPANFGAVYHEDRLDDIDEEIATDGGHAARTEVEMSGFGLTDYQSFWSLIGSGLGLAASGYLWGLPNTGLAALIVFCVSIGIGYIAARSFGGGLDA
ncbi:hypothetical protein [Halorussus marinus]|uniref:hypothetical protein n=1 Tax=Halorussus marinus TaxID=2505976 RepID=UPI001092B033|nr:hypothetical protein [Halorussus marinus]